MPGKTVREDYPPYPLALREAVANAICHRDYTTPGGSVAIGMYDDKLEIINPEILYFDNAREINSAARIKALESYYCECISSCRNY
ncbi:hypothetical protein [Candidatus Protochlamydia amoebophila]|uniref:hypothetical protein n=1 Tax=Candidatus Protochlamydia amoebophila TaxID=362787 RepID=UPI000580364A|nr:hypothetical protein [Candidatus Protochlamydia amoebophila]